MMESDYELSLDGPSMVAVEVARRTGDFRRNHEFSARRRTPAPLLVDTKDFLGPSVRQRTGGLITSLSIIRITRGLYPNYPSHCES